MHHMLFRYGEASRWSKVESLSPEIQCDVCQPEAAILYHKYRHPSYQSSLE